MRKERSFSRDASSTTTGDKMEINKTVSNPMLVGAMQLIKADGNNPDPAHQVMFLEQLDGAELLAPADVKAEVGPDGEKLMDKKHTVRFPVLTGADGRRFFVVFTDNAALERARKLEGASKLPEEFVSEAVTVKLADMAKFILTPGPDGSENTTFGIVINPFMENIVIPKSLMMNIVAKRAQEARARLEKATKRMEAMEGGDIIQFPTGEKKEED